MVIHWLNDEQRRSLISLRGSADCSRDMLVAHDALFLSPPATNS